MSMEGSVVETFRLKEEKERSMMTNEWFSLKLCKFLRLFFSKERSEKDEKNRPMITTKEMDYKILPSNKIFARFLDLG